MATFALDEEKVAHLVGAIYMRVRRNVALMALAYNIFCDPFGAAFIENKILPFELGREVFCAHFMSIINNAAVELVDVFKTFIFQVSARFFTTDAAGTVEEKLLFLLQF